MKIRVFCVFIYIRSNFVCIWKYYYFSSFFLKKWSRLIEQMKRNANEQDIRSCTRSLCPVLCLFVWFVRSNVSLSSLIQSFIIIWRKTIGRVRSNESSKIPISPFLVSNCQGRKKTTGILDLIRSNTSITKLCVGLLNSTDVNIDVLFRLAIEHPIIMVDLDLQCYRMIADDVNVVIRHFIKKVSIQAHQPITLRWIGKSIGRQLTTHTCEWSNLSLRYVLERWPNIFNW